MFSIVCSGDSTDSTTAASTTAGSTVTTVTSTGRRNNEQQGDSSTLIGDYSIRFNPSAMNTTVYRIIMNSPPLLF